MYEELLLSIVIIIPMIRIILLRAVNLHFGWNYLPVKNILCNDIIITFLNNSIQCNILFNNNNNNKCLGCKSLLINIFILILWLSKQ